MELVTPKVFLIGETVLIPEGLQEYLDHIGVPEWTTNAPSDAEALIEVMGRLCYRSFAPGMNPNVSKVREGNDIYVGNILGQKHGSVIEHSSVNFVFADVSRVFTHELVRHRVGTAISQESLRYVRLEDLRLWAPTAIRENEVAMQVFADTFTELEEVQKKLARLYRLDDTGVTFHFKKQVTSAMRRVAPIGLATTIGWSANFRTLRWVLEMRTHPSAEEEIRVVFGQVGKLMLERYPNVFGDFIVEDSDGLPYYYAKNSKI